MWPLDIFQSAWKAKIANILCCFCNTDFEKADDCCFLEVIKKKEFHQKSLCMTNV